MLPGKTYTPDDVVAIAWRYRWAITIPAVLVTVIAVGVAIALPNKYRSETLVLVVPQRVPESYVRATVTTRIEERVRSIREQILSRTNLERIIGKFNLYADERARLPMEDVIEIMRNNVATRIVREDAFLVSFTSDSPQTAQKVTERLAGLFSEENMKDRQVQAESTYQFLQTQLDEARQRLTEQDRRVELYRRGHTGELPEQVNANLQAIQNAELQIQTLTQALNNDRERLVILDRQLADASAPNAPPVAAPPASGPNPSASLEEQLEAARAAVRTLQTRLTAQHPDLVQAKAAVARLERQLAAEQVSAPNEESGPAPILSGAEASRRARVAELRAQVDTLTRQITQKTQEERRLRSLSAAYGAKVEAAPTRQTEMVALTRDYETLQRQYRSLLEKFEESKVAANLERRQIGEQFRILDPARVPERPYTPRRVLITAAGAGAGLALGLALAGLLEFRDKSVRSSADAAGVLAISVLAVVPTILSAVDRRSRRRRQRIAATVAFVCGATVTVGFAVWTSGFLFR